jgi:hypothetical protein
MLLGSIPIVERGINMDQFAEFPMWLIENWSEVTPETLAANRERIRSRPFDKAKLYMAHWHAQIEAMACRRGVRGLNAR